MALRGRARRVALAFGLLVVLGALSLAAASNTPTAPDRHQASSIITARDLTFAPNATRPAKSLRLGLLAALLSAAFSAEITIQRLKSGRRGFSRRGAGQFYARRRGPPALLVAH